MSELQTVLNRLGRNSFGSPVYFIPVILVLTLPRISDVLRLGGNPLHWLAASVVGITAMFALLGLLQLLFLRRLLGRGRHPFVNVLVFAAMGLTRGVAYGYTADYFDLIPDPNFMWRLPTSTMVAVLIGALTFQVAGAVAENRELSAGLVQKRQLLLEAQAELLATAEGEQARLRTDALAAITPKIQSLEAMLNEPSADRNQVASELKSLVGTTLREHLNNIWLETRQPTDLRPARLTLRDFGVTSKFRLRRQLEPSPIAAILLLAALTSMWQWSGWFGIFVVFMITSAYWLIAKVVMAIIPREFLIATWLGLPLVLAFPTLLLSPAGEIALALLGPNANGERALSYIGVFVPVIAGAAMATRHLDFALERYRADLAGVNLALERDLAITRRRIWLLRRNWHLKLHGEFQGALTAILARLSLHPLAAIDSALVRRELDLALNALESEGVKPKLLSQTLDELAATWRDVVDLDAQFSAQVETLLNTDDEARQCVAELVREAVNNASKHGKANRMRLTLDRPSDDLVTITAINNGLLVDDVTRGIGTQFYSDLCLSWSLDNLPDGSGVVLTASIPVRPTSLPTTKRERLASATQR